MSCFNLIGVVLAGGASRRMGHDKASLPWRDSTLLAHSVTLMRPLCADVVVSGKAQGISDSRPYGGPVQALQDVVNDARTQSFDAMLICAVDAPLLTQDDLTQLVTALSEHNAGYYQHNYLPLALRLTAQNRQLIAAVASDQIPAQRSLRQLTQQLKAAPLALSENRQARLLSLNTPALYQQHRQQET